MEWAPEATPQSRDEVLSAPRCPEVVVAAQKRGVTSLVHFTTIKGLVGVLASGEVKCRRDLPDDDLVRHVYEPNAANRSLDERWHGYVNLSVTNINLRMFNFSVRQRRIDEWVILKFGPKILRHRGVVFCTTNNIYPAAHRSQGLRGFEQMFAASVPGWYGHELDRDGRLPCETTDPQAEVLYPFSLSLKHLHTITANNEDAYGNALDALSIYPGEPTLNTTPEEFR